MKDHPNPDQARLRQSILARLETRIQTRGEVILPSVPSLLDEYVDRLTKLFQALGKQFTPEELVHLQQLLATQLQQGFAASPHSHLLFRYEPSQPPAVGISYTLSVATSSVAEQYNSWLQTREPPLFGTHPDAKIMDLVQELGKPERWKILDVGAGTGRNTLPLAKLGYQVDALELAPGFVEQLRQTAAKEGLNIKVIEGDILDPLVRLRPANYHFVICAEVLSHFRDRDQLRLFMAKMCDYLCYGGLLLFNLFLTPTDYQPNDLEREMSQVVWSSLFTPHELQDALEELPLELLTEESVLNYEKSHLPPEAWPPTGWFENWATGRDLYAIAQGQIPMELRWILCRRK